MNEKYEHIILTQLAVRQNFKTPSKWGGGPPRIPPRDRDAHAQKLLEALAIVQSDEEGLRARGLSTRMWTYVEFASASDADLITKSLESVWKWIRLLNVKEVENQGLKQIKATVYIPNGQENFFIKKVTAYRSEDTKKNKPKNAPLVESIETIGLAFLEAFWTDLDAPLPTDQQKWHEIWLNIDMGQSIEAQKSAFENMFRELEIEHKESVIVFQERLVILAFTNREQLLRLLLKTDFLAEVRSAQQLSNFLIELSSADQAEWVEDLLWRVTISETNTKICILDTWVNNGHPLLCNLIKDDDTLSVNHMWRTHDHDGHGTMMAGISAYWDLKEAIESTKPIHLSHQLCSVKILPPRGQTVTPEELWGAITEQAVYTAEIANPQTKMVYCMAVTAPNGTNRWRPSSWSALLDAITFRNITENGRLVIVSTGNIEENWRDYLDTCRISQVQNPAQSWNALAVWGYTEKVIVDLPGISAPIAPRWGISPYSSTSLPWEGKWPIKPDIVFEGGNLLVDESHPPELEEISTNWKFNSGGLLTAFHWTSLATAKASWFAGMISSQYPMLWSETIRGLMIHSANWTDTMIRQFNINIKRKTDVSKLLRAVGYGVPNLEKALYSTQSALSMIIEETIQPFKKVWSDAKLNEMHFYELPWPKDELLNLGNLPVKLRITLSYFIEPGPGEIGWKDKYRYPSHGLRFRMNNPGQTKADFIKHVNLDAREEGEVIEKAGADDRWTIGSQNRNHGSVHSDSWEWTAAELSQCNLIAVFPVVWWWRERKHLWKVNEKARYSLIVSLETEKEDVTLYTTIKSMISVPVEIEVSF